MSYCIDNKCKASKKHLPVGRSVWIRFGGAVQGLDWGSTVPPQSSSGRHLLLRPSWAAAAVARLNYSEIESGPTRRDAVRRGEASRAATRLPARQTRSFERSPRRTWRGGERREGIVVQPGCPPWLTRLLALPPTPNPDDCTGQERTCPTQSTNRH